MVPATRETTFERGRAVVWVCDIEGSSRAINDPKTVEGAELFLQRFFWTAALVMETTGARVRKWTGDGFVAAYHVDLDRNLGEAAERVLTAAWHLTLLVNVTHLALTPPPRFRVRHGVTFEPDAIFVTHASGDTRTSDVIGRGVVLAFRLSGMPAAFPGIVSHRPIVLAAKAAGLRGQRFDRRAIRAEDRLKYFKGEAWGTSDIHASANDRPRRRSTPASLRATKKAVDRALERVKVQAEVPWLSAFHTALKTGPEWAQETSRLEIAYLREELLPAVKAAADALQRLTKEPPA